MAKSKKAITLQAHYDYEWSLAVFFECYITGGAEGTRKEFGPRKPRKLKLVKKHG